MIITRFRINLIIDDINKFANIFGESVTQQAQTLIYEFAKKAIQQYYDEYPVDQHVLYNPRTDLMLNRSYKKYREGYGINSAGGIEIDSGFTRHPDTPHRIDWTEGNIYNEVWNEGYHGWKRDGNSYQRIGSGTNYLSLIERQAYSNETLSKIGNKAMEAARRGSYSMLVFS